MATKTTTKASSPNAAKASAKGPAGKPSTTGKPSGKGRQNKPAKK